MNQSSYYVIQLPPINSVPELTITWFRNITVLNNEGLRNQVTLNQSLVLLGQEMSDSGSLYKAAALNGITGKIVETSIYNVTIIGQDNLPLYISPVIVVPMKDASVKRGDTKISFECIASAKPMDNIQTIWYKVNGSNRIPIVNNQDKYILSHIKNRTLTIKVPDNDDAGIYECEVSLMQNDQQITGTRKALDRATLFVSVNPLITTQFPNDISKDFGDRVVIPCRAIGPPQPTIHWLFNGLEIQNDSNRYTIDSNGTLTVERLDVQNAGMYQCFARNDAGDAYKSVWLKVNRAPPQLKNPPQNVTVIEGTDARFPCETTGAPVPVTTWFKVVNDLAVQIKSEGRFQIQYLGELLITTTQPEDSGIYRCIAVNIVGNISAQAYLQVYVKTEINRPPQDLTVIKGRSAALQCGVSHDPQILVTWHWYYNKASQDAGVFTEIISDDRRYISSDGTLTINGIYNEDIGTYQCQVQSIGGNDSRTVRLVVIELPQKPAITNVEVHPINQTAAVVSFVPYYDGNSPILHFNVQFMEVTGTEIDTGSWVTFPLNINPENRSVMVTDLRPARFYQFRVSATNVVGEGVSSDPKPTPPLEMPQQPPSSPPRFFSGGPQTNTSIRLSWQAPPEDSQNGPLLGYTIRYKLKSYASNPFAYANVTQSAQLSYELKGLAYFEYYELQIAAYNGKGTGVFSESITVRTLEGHPTASPENVTVEATNSTSIRVKWTPPNQQFINGINQGYKVEAKRTEVIQTEIVAIVSPNPTNPTGLQTTQLTNLKKFTQYSITVLCYTSQGEGPKSAPRVIRTDEDFPGRVDSLTFQDIRDTSLKVIWTPPSEINGILTGYVLRYEKKNDSSTMRVVDLPQSNLSFTIYNLSPMTKYSIYVQAKTSKGSGENRSADIESGVPPELPQPPRDLAFSNIQARSVLVQFYPGYDGKTSITRWIVQALEGSDTAWKEIYQVSDPDARSILVYNLRPFTNYRLRLIAENIVGQSGSSDPTGLFQTLQDAPSVPPGNVTVRALNATAIRVSWTPLSEIAWNGVPRGYRIYYKLKDSLDNFRIITLEGLNTDSNIIDKLEEWMEYEVKMVAYNDVGNSSFSPITVERTRESVPSSGPSNVQAVAKSSTSVNVTWGDVPLLDTNGMIKGYKVQYRSDEENISPVQQTIAGNETKFGLVQNLRKFVTYEIQVLAYTSIGDGVLSFPEVKVQTHADVPGPPVIIWFPEVTYNQARIVWESPVEPNGIITNYMVSYREKYNTSQWTNSPALTPSIREYTVTNLKRETYYIFNVTAKTLQGWGETASVEVYTMIDRSYLRPNTIYVFRVAATNDIGTSAFSVQSEEVKTLSDKPEGAPRNVIVKPLSTTSVNVTWQQPPTSTWNGDLLGYYVVYRIAEPSSPVNQELVTYPKQEKVLAGLVKKVNYEFRIIAFNIEGDGPSSVPVTIFVGEAAPSAPPINIRSTSLNSSEIIIQWDPPPPETQNGDLTGYKVFFWEASASENTAVQIIIRELQVTLRQLKIYTGYSFTILAYNLAGEGPKSQILYQQTREGLPSRPVKIEFWNVTYTSLDITWLAPQQPNGQIQEYVLSYVQNQLDGPTKIVNQRVRGDVNTLNISDLEKETTYTFSVRAKTLVGEGPDVNKTVKTGPQNGSAGAPFKPSIASDDKTLTIKWKQGSSGFTPVYSFIIQEKNDRDKPEWFTSREVSSEQTSVDVALSELADGVNYQYRIIAMNSIGISEPSPASDPFKKPPKEETPFHYEWWFLVIVALAGLIIILTIISLLCLLNRRKTAKKKKASASLAASQLRQPGPTTESEDGGFSSMEMSRPSGTGRQNFARIGNGSSKTIYARPPPRPSPASVVYSDDDDSVSKPPIPDDDDDDGENSSVTTTGKPSVADSNEPSDDESDVDSEPLPPPPPPLPSVPPSSSPPPPPFMNLNAYNNTTPYDNNRKNNGWRPPQPNTSFNAYQYTDSEAESSHYAFSLNGGQVVMNNRAGSRAPLPGYSSFV
ncbi:hypothetical protein ACJMK2_033296 [Sinanodonta woodiana]|uniref:Sidekick n=1 Tax=Sinanodonta woodiana TaxID=1069815 RepID=A0ABD3WRL6_SINWO